MYESKIVVKRAIRPGVQGNSWTKKQVAFADIVINDVSLYKIFCERGYDVISCLGWSFTDIQQKRIEKLLLLGESDFSTNRYAIYICPECGDLGCGAISVNIERQDDTIIWKEFGFEDDLNIFPCQFDRFKDIGPFQFNWNEYSKAIKSSLDIGDTFFRKEKDHYV